MKICISCGYTSNNDRAMFCSKCASKMVDKKAHDRELQEREKAEQERTKAEHEKKMQADYKKACDLGDSAKNVRELRDVIEKFSKLGDYKDTKKLVEQYNNQLLPKLKSRNKRIVISALSIIISAALLIVLANIILPAINRDNDEQPQEDTYSEEYNTPELSPAPSPSQVSQYSIGDIISFGDYNWRILDRRGEKILIITENIIDCKAYSEYGEGYTEFTEELSVTWETSSLRDYLNGEFYNSFSPSDKTCIEMTSNSNDYNPWFDTVEAGTAGGSETEDYVFLLSVEEVIKYFGGNGQLQQSNYSEYWNENYGAFFIDDQFNDNRIAKHTGDIYPSPTDDREFYLINKDDEYNWWLRSSTGSVYSYIVVGGSVYDNIDYNTGSITYLHAHYNLGGVRPALWLDLRSEATISSAIPEESLQNVSSIIGSWLVRDDDDLLTFYEDGTGSFSFHNYDGPDEGGDFTYTTNGNELIMDTDYGDSDIRLFAIKDDVLLFYWPDFESNNLPTILTSRNSSVLDRYDPDNIEVVVPQPKKESITVSNSTVWAFGTDFKGQNVYIVKPDGSLWGWGCNEYGQIGDGTTVERHYPVYIMDDVTSVYGTGRSTYAIKGDGSLWAWGRNEHNQLGDGTNTDRYEPVQIMEDVAFVSTNSAVHSSYTFAIRKDGSLWGWGGEDAFGTNDGQLGNGTYTGSSSPVWIMDDVSFVQQNYGNTFAIKNDNSLWAWGKNEYGALGIGSTINQPTPVKVMDGVVDIAITMMNGFAITENGSLWGWGYNESGYLGDGTDITRLSPVLIMEDVAKVSITWSNAVMAYALKNDGSVWVWGWNTNGWLGDGTELNRSTPVKIPLDELDDIVAISPPDSPWYALGNDGSLWIWYRGKIPAKIMSNVRFVSASYRTYYVITDDGVLWAWGNNCFGQIGDGTTEDRQSPVRIMDGLTNYVS